MSEIKWSRKYNFLGMLILTIEENFGYAIRIPQVTSEVTFKKAERKSKEKESE